jgi:hypothetical protein
MTGGSSWTRAFNEWQEVQGRGGEGDRLLLTTEGDEGCSRVGGGLSVQ